MDEWIRVCWQTIVEGVIEVGKAVQQEVDDVLESLGSRSDGLSKIEVSERQNLHGANSLNDKGVGALSVLIRQFKSPFIYLLVAAAGVAWFLQEHMDAWMIIAFVVINAALGFYQEFKSEQTVKLLKKHLAMTVKVKRGGIVEEVLVDQLTVGDVVMLEPGDIVPADMRLVEVEALAVDEALLTGESMSVNKVTGAILKEVGVVDARNMVFAGTTVVSGNGLGVVIVVGKHSQLGKISKLTTETKSSGVFEKEIAKFSKFILQLVVVTLVVVFVANMVIKGGRTDNLEFALFAVALAVSVVPEALPVVATFSFSRGAMKLAKNKVVVKRLSAVEDLGSIEVLCTDKTGTLTENKMVVRDVWGESDEVLRWAAVGIVGGTKLTNPFDIAIAATQKNNSRYEVLKLRTFDPERKRDVRVVKGRDGMWLVSRGAPETILSLCKRVEKKDELEGWMKEQGESGRRVWAVGVKKLTSLPEDIGKAEKGMELLGVIAFEDPIKKSAVAAVRKAQELGVRIVVLTGDKQEVAESVAKRINLVDGEDQVMSGEMWDRLDLEHKKEAVGEVKVFCRVNPQQKYDIIQLLQDEFHVGYIGDGINDAPALKLANVALAVKEASDIARDAADIVLLRKDLEVIIEGIKQGREIFVNTTKYVKATLAANFGNFYAVTVASLLIDYLPMLPVQILLVNLLSDFPMIAVAADSVDPEELVVPKRFDLKEVVILATILGVVSSVFDFMTFAIFSRMGEQILQTNWFMESILTELAFIYSVRTKWWFFKGTKPAGVIVVFTLLAAGVTIALPWMSVGGELFGFVRPSLVQLMMVGALVVGYFATNEVVKAFYYRKNS